MSQVVAGRSPLLNVMASAAEKAGRSLRRDFGEIEQLQSANKGLKTFVNSCIHYARSNLLKELGKARPSFGLIADNEKQDEPGREAYWIVNSLDGVDNLSHGINQLAISIAVEKDSEIIASVVFNPITNELYLAERGKGAFLNQSRIRVGQRKTLEESLIAFYNVAEAKKNPALNKLLQGSLLLGNLRFSGVPSLDLAFIASGRLDVYSATSLTKQQSAAGLLLVKEAGGLVWNDDESSSFPCTFASNSFLMDAVKSLSTART